MTASGPGCVKTPPPSDGRSRLQMQRDMPLTSLGGDNALSVGALASSENLTGLKAILSVHFYVFTQPGPKADIPLTVTDCESVGLHNLIVSDVLPPYTPIPSDSPITTGRPYSHR